MRSGKHLSTEAWLLLNMSNKDTAQDSPLFSSPGNSIRLRILPMLLAISAVVVSAMWYEEQNLGLMNIADYIGYPILLTVTTLGALLLKFRPATLRFVMITAFTTYIAYLLSSYYIEMVHRLYDGIFSNYEITALSLWLPFGYVGSFVFFPPRVALRASLAIYAAIALPQLLLIMVETDSLVRLIAIAIIISQPLYISALWGVGLLKTQALGVQNIAKTMNEAATIDALTGIANRRAMDHALQKIIQAQQDTPRSLALLIIDVDHFKRVNDTYGHAIGDEVLIRFAQEASAHLRSSDLLGRWGGEEFMILSLDQTDAQAMQMADRLRTELEKTHFPHVGMVTVSIGVTSYVPGEGADALIKRADKALYHAKAQGRNRVEGMFEEYMTALSYQTPVLNPQQNPLPVDE